ncbi:MAG: hypothetical protein L6416_02960 [Candidatus Omnitrophica bacterium]|nr:hypothetical protein [Candidatus Omnitrophota bacterium]
MKKFLVRIWQELESDEVKKHLLLAGELTANCENCRHLGIDFFKETVCQQCGTDFKYIGIREKSNKAEELFAIKRIKEKRPDLVVVDCEDIQRAFGKSKARDLLGL